MFDKFKKHLIKFVQVKSKCVPYYVKWVADFYSFLGRSAPETVTNQEKEKFLDYLSKDHED